MKPLVTAVFAIVLAAGDAFALTGHQYLPQAKVTPKRARQLAEKAWTGKILSEELEEEGGGSGLRYSFIIQQGNTKHEVGIDAKTGKLLENSLESGSDTD